MRLSLVPVALLSLLPLACGGSDPDPNDPSQMQASGGQYQAGGYQQQPTGGYQQPTGGYQQPTGGYQQPTTTQPGTTTQPAAGGGQATAVAPGMAGAATPILTAMAAAEVQGMQPDGQAFAAQFQPGQTFEQPINIQAGKCYSVIGVGLGVTELDIQLVIQPAPQIPATVLAQDNTTGSNATLGGKGSCFKNPLPMGGPGKVILKATAGQGLAIAQVYIK